ncbi:Holliday junction resolvase RuvX [Deinococcus wulumuqiensis]|uniref:Putative pre-16S rRNA nuclease n=1 Tax=Deinococcus wulumuqiensis TaxID=980427 RepID=A0AAV4K6X8_9DEIO|nr:Holliday junction resolvase RuvX [Deinococcus wulumuqiensis]QII21416.1 Holliday junction resolvase RuvX [Deinococcus wulumuqiensis R12]GGI82660.1 putative pre-16S rRNA nuclease [Deinococcus wulumuqiensis]GGP29479.1 putative pre-16S rRNA nuclease [Deinococcus wulumuqiensis]
MLAPMLDPDPAPAAVPTVLALDVSKSRIGFATNAGRLAFGRGSVDRKRLPLDLKAVRLKVEETGAERLLLGLPLRTDGKPSPAADRVRAFGRVLEEKGYVVAYQDERFTTQRARALGAADEDEAAAVQILELWLLNEKP